MCIFCHDVDDGNKPMFKFDFTPLGGPANLTAWWDHHSVIRFPDGSEWHKPPGNTNPFGNAVLVATLLLVVCCGGGLWWVVHKRTKARKLRELKAKVEATFAQERELALATTRADWKIHGQAADGGARDLGPGGRAVPTVELESSSV